MMTVLVVAALAAMIASFAWSRRQLDPRRPAALAAIALRCAGFGVLIFIVLQPARLPSPQTVTTRRVLAVLVDQSASMSTGGAGATRLDRARAMVRDHRVVEQVSEVAEIAIYGFDADLIPIDPAALDALEPAGRRTDLASSIERAVRRHRGSDLAGLLILSDGRHTEGAEPRDAARRLKTPLFTAAVTDPALPDAPVDAPRDLALTSVTAEPRLVLGQSARIVCAVESLGYPPRQVAVTLHREGRTVATTAVALSAQQPKRPALLVVTPDRVGSHRYEARIAPEPDETDPTNNVAEITIDVVDPVNRLLYVDRLRFERRFLKPVIAGRRNLRYAAVVPLDGQRNLVQGDDEALRAVAADLTPDGLRQVKAMILGDLPASAFDPEQIAAIRDWVGSGGALMILGGPQSLGADGFIEALGTLIPVTLDRPAPYVEAPSRVRLTPAGAAHPAFQRVSKQWESAAPLLSRFGAQGVRAAATVLLETTEPVVAPLVVSRRAGHGKAAIVLTDSTWRWQLGHDRAGPGAAGGADTPHAVFWQQMIDWLLPDIDQTDDEGGQVQLLTDRTTYEVRDAIEVVVNVRGADGSAAKGADVRLTIASPDGRPIERTAEPAGGDDPTYRATFDAAYAGAYAIQATASVAGRPIGVDRIVVNAVQPLVEFTRTEPDPQLMKDLALLSGGKYLEPSDLDDLVRLARLEPREVVIQPNADHDAVPVWNRWWLLALFVAIMTAEWVVRKRNQWV
ncbi:MAG: hypothetical protein CMJ18_06265 [Phycisphaeraceae bacterium]|nr:hypothetical protein [Phycisphaeraceae bacterium]